MSTPSPDHDHVEEVGPTETYDPLIKTEMKRAIVWALTVTAFLLVWLLSQPLLIIFGGIVVAAIFDGGARLLTRFLPIPRGLALAIVVILAFLLAVWVFAFAGSELAAQAVALQDTIERQATTLSAWARERGFLGGGVNFADIGQQLVNSLGQVTAAVTSVFGAIASIAMMLVLGVFIAAEPRLYERGIAWMLPLAEREFFYGTMDRMGHTMRRLMAGRLFGMAVEGVGTWLLLMAGGVPMAALLGLLTGLLAFLPNIGAIISGGLIILVGFSAGPDIGIYALIVYLVVQAVDGYLIVPMVAKKAVDLAPALVLGAQILFGAIFGILGLALADPIVAMLKVALERRSEKLEERARRRRAKQANRKLPPLAGQSG